MSHTQYPNILKLKTLEFEIELLMKAYKTGEATYQQYILTKNYTDATNKLAELSVINSRIETNIAAGEEILDEMEKDGSLQKIQSISFETPNFKNITTQVNTQQNKVKTLQQNISNIDGDLNNTVLNQNSNYLQYIILVIVGIIVAGLTIKTIITKQDAPLDSAILVIIIGVIIYFILKKLLNYSY